MDSEEITSNYQLSTASYNLYFTNHNQRRENCEVSGKIVYYYSLSHLYMEKSTDGRILPAAVTLSMKL